MSISISWPEVCMGDGHSLRQGPRGQSWPGRLLGP